MNSRSKRLHVVFLQPTFGLSVAEFARIDTTSLREFVNVRKSSLILTGGSLSNKLTWVWGDERMASSKRHSAAGYLGNVRFAHPMNQS